jgi:hypothetical protein
MTYLETFQEAQGVVSNYVDDMLFYLQEKSEEIGYDGVADAFISAYKIMVHQLVRELKEADEEEG